MSSAVSSEKLKDVVLNGILALSIVLLIVGYIKAEPKNRIDNPADSQYRVMRLEPLSTREVPTYEELTVLEPSGGTSSENSRTQHEDQISTQTSTTSAFKPKANYVLPPSLNFLDRGLNSTKLRLY